MKKIQAGEEVEENQEVVSYTFDELLNLTYKLVLNTDYYEKSGDTWVDKSENAVYMKKLIEDALELKVVGIVRPSEEAVASSIGAAVGYTSDLTEYVINNINDSEIVKEQKENPDIDVFTGKAFVVEDDEDTDMMSIDMSTLTDEEKAYLASLSQEELQALMKQQATATDATYEGNLSLLGCVDLDNPSTINIYAKDFEAKESIEDIITDYNNEKIDLGEDEYVVTYNDIVGLMMSSVTSIIDIISYVLIAFVAISLVVSSIMIGIITYISVLERTKEIGILRSIGASKKDISRVFNAETVIVGFAAGAIGIIVTVLL
ncbi:ABC transporter permease, partial [Clostridium saudiense]|nr:ABC transporter permease [Clostridium saudiense]